MSTLYLVRHGQASFGKEDYDQLSDLGYEQALVAGEYLAKVTQPTTFVSGSLKRQRQTLQKIKQGYSDKVIANSKSLELPAFNEFDHHNILEVVQPNLREPHGHMLASLTTRPDALAEFLALYKHAVNRWIINDGDFKESFSVFTQRIATGLTSLMAMAESDQDIVLVSSAGPISSSIQFGTDLSAESAFSLSDVMINAAITALEYDEKTVPTLLYFNNFQHLIYGGSEVTRR
jgi:broad specificity phosphatase PhoE